MATTHAPTDSSSSSCSTRLRRILYRSHGASTLVSSRVAISIESVPGPEHPDLRPLGNYLGGVVETELRAENLPTDTSTDLQADSLRLAKTASRSTLGFMTEMAFELGWIIADMGGPRRCDVNVLKHGLRRMLWNRGDYVRPIELFNQRLDART